jgi:hypothetical protein
MSLVLRARMVELVSDANPDVRWMSSWLEVNEVTEPSFTHKRGKCVTAFEMMCEALMSDIQSAEGSGADALKEIARIESGETDRIEADGNAWVAYITRDKVWFEGLYSQGEGGEVSFAQYKLAVQTYVRFLADPEHKPIEVEFPDR